LGVSVLYATFSLIDWRCHLLSGSDREISGEALWIAPGHARINEDVSLTELPLTFTIRAHTPASQVSTEGRVGWLRYDPPWEADHLKHSAQLCVVLVVAREEFSDLWERGPGRVPQRIFAEIEGFKDEYQYAPGDKLWEINAAERAEVRIKPVPFRILLVWSLSALPCARKHGLVPEETKLLRTCALSLGNIRTSATTARSRNIALS
jgi:hypothetical protein